MKCKCSLNNNYEVIGLCDIEKFNEKISAFQDKSWTQITIPERLTIPKSKPSIKEVTKIYLNIKVTSTKIIETPSSNNDTSIEGLKLTGKLLLVVGTICQNIIYISKTNCSTIHSVTFTVPFNTYIVINGNVDLENDKFCVYPCVEDVSIRLLDERSLSKNVTLFLFAHQTTITPEPPVIPKITNTFIFKTQNGSGNVAIVGFDVDTMTLIVDSTGTAYSNTGTGNAFTFTLLNPDGSTKSSGTIGVTEDGSNFKTMLEGNPFKVGDFIEIRYSNPDNAILTDYPDKGDEYTMYNRGSKEKFVITQDGVTPILVPNKIIVKSKNDEIVLTVAFNITKKQFDVSSRGVEPDPTAPEAYPYFTLIQKGAFGIDKKRVILNSNENGDNFKIRVNKGPLVFDGDILTFVYGDKSKIEITDYPPINNDFNIFLVKTTGLENIGFDSKIKIINDQMKQMASIYFAQPISAGPPNAVTLIATSTNAQSTTTGHNNEVYFDYVQYDENSVQHHEQIMKMSTASNFANNLDGTHANIPPDPLNIIRLQNYETDASIITNYNGQAEYNVSSLEFIEIQRNALVPHDRMYNIIGLNDNSGIPVLYLYFDKVSNTTVYIELIPLGTIYDGTRSFTFKITDPNDESRIKVQGTLRNGQTAFQIPNLDRTNQSNISNNFNIGDTLILEYSDRTKVEVYNVSSETLFSNPTGTNFQKYRITANGLVPK